MRVTSDKIKPAHMNMIGSYVTDFQLKQIDAFAEAQQITQSMAIRVLLAMAIMELK